MKMYSILISIIGAIATFSSLDKGAIAQIIPDHTLGQENSIITPNLIIEGGAIRGNNLLHSFQEFNVNSLEKVYFNQPSNIDNIITRITGQNISNINGTLGVLGNGNLFLINPNGIIFGNQAKLDIKGSFVASTSPEIKLGNEMIFSATNPQTPPLLKINVPLGLQLGTPTQNNIINLGNLQVGNNLTFTANNITINGNLKTHTGDIRLKAEDTLKIRDNVSNPVIIQSGKDLRLTGKNKLDIFTLNHPQSVFLSGKDLTLTSNNPVGGDGKFNSQGKFRIEKLDQTLGDLSSPFDPVIKTLGDVQFNSYTGGSLHILAGGSVNIPGLIEINTKDAPESLRETINLTDGSQININGNTKPTLDIRAGIDWQQVGGTPTDAGNNPSNANINIGKILIRQPDGLVFLSNQYYPNTKLSSGDINFQSIDTRSDTGNSGSVIIDSRNNIVMNNAPINTNTDLNINQNFTNYKSGNVQLIANGDITMNNSKIQTSDFLGLRVRKIEKSGNINIKSRGLSLINSQLDSTFFGYQGGLYGAGEIKIDVQNKITLDNSKIGSLQDSGGNPNDIIEIKARELELKNNSKIVLPTTNGSSESGLIALKTEQLTLTNNSIIETTATFGFAGNINIETGNLTVSDSSQIKSNFAGVYKGAAGNVIIKADDVTVEKNSLIGAESALTLAAEGYINNDVGSITMTGRNNSKIENLRVSDNSSISTRVYDGIVFVETFIEDIYTDYKPNAFGGKINIGVSNLILDNHGHIQANGDVKKQVLAQNIIGSLPSGDLIFGP
ncbi:MAG TPA: filamentous hemagglutinin N-terminal domain-containing protein, partial [Allocoleopsis sp.]